MSELKSLFLYRIENGKKVRYRFAVDDNMVIQSETIDAEQKVTGIQYERAATGQKVITGVDQETQKALMFFLLDQPCPFGEGCEELREAYKKEQSAIDPKCPDCTHSNLTRKYLDKVKNAMLGG
jgi:hypothetical protein